MTWRDHMAENVCSWLTRGDTAMRLEPDFLMLFGNPYLFQQDKLMDAFSEIAPAGLFHTGTYRNKRVSFCFPLFGAPSVAMYTEVIARLGGKNIVACGYVGGIDGDMAIGSYFIGEAAHGFDGCSRSYSPDNQRAIGCETLIKTLRASANERKTAHLTGSIASIDALMLEDDEMIADLQAKGFAAIDLETACLYNLAQSLDLCAGAVHIVTDNPTRKLIDRDNYHEASFSDQIQIALSALSKHRGD
jgi:purine-nucleoside phosphorylase